MADNPNTFINEDTESLRTLIEIRKRLESIDHKMGKMVGPSSSNKLGSSSLESGWNPFSMFSGLSKKLTSMFGLGAKITQPTQQQQQQSGSTPPGPKTQPQPNYNWFAPAFAPILQKLQQVSTNLLGKAGTSPQQLGNQLLNIYGNLMTQLSPNSNLWKSIFNAIQKSGQHFNQKDVIIKGIEDILGNTLASKLEGLFSKLERVLLVAKAAGGDPQAQSQLAQLQRQEAAQRMRQRIMSGFRGAANWASETMGGNDRIERIGQQMFSGLSRIGDRIPGVFGKAIKYVGDFGEGLFKGVEKLRKWTDRLHDADMRFAEVSASMAQVMAERHVRDIMLARERGDRRSAAARYREEATSRFERNIAPVEDAFANLQSWINGAVQNVGSSVVEAFYRTFPRLAAWLQEGQQLAESGGPDHIQHSSWLSMMGQDWEQRAYGRPSAFGQEQQ